MFLLCVAMQYNSVGRLFRGLVTAGNLFQIGLSLIHYIEVTLVGRTV